MGGCMLWIKLRLWRFSKFFLLCLDDGEVVDVGLG
jgi:hypothetical protein